MKLPRPRLPLLKFTSTKAVRIATGISFINLAVGVTANHLGYKTIWAIALLFSVLPVIYIHAAPKLNFWLHGKNKFDAFEDQLNKPPDDNH